MNKYILFVDDNEDVLGINSKIAEKANYTFMTAKNGNEAIRLLEDILSEKRDLPSLIVSEIKMVSKPKGIELINKYRELCPNTPIIVVTSLIDGYLEDLNRMKIPYFEKPYKVSPLINKINDMIE